MAECVAALEAKAEDLAARVKAGAQDGRPQLQAQLEYGAAFIGAAYLDGERDEARSRALLDAARERQVALPDQDLRTRQQSCAAEGSRLLANANALGRVIVSRAARKRMAKLLAP